MITANSHIGSNSPLTNYRWRRVVYIAVFWTLLDFVYTALSVTGLTAQHTPSSLVVRGMLMFAISMLLGYLFMFSFRRLLADAAMWVNFLLKSLILLVSALLLNIFVTSAEHFFIYGFNYDESVKANIEEIFTLRHFAQRTFFWLGVFVVTQLYIEINDKYSPGVFLDILAGKYRVPKVEKRIVMFLDLKDSTPIAEHLGHEQYFLFIREFIKLVSEALIIHQGIIYQYVGDEVVVSWPYSKSNIKKALAAVITARKKIQRKSESFRRHFDMVPEFRVGIHLGEVTIGEIGVIKKDLAMSGDTMNTTARIRSACNELNQKFIVSKEFKEAASLTDWQLQSLGVVDLKGKGEGVELFSLKI